MSITALRGSRVVFTGPLKVDILDAEPWHLQANEVLVQTRLTLISAGTELTVLRGGHTCGSHWDRAFAYPWNAGYCNVGVVVELGKDVEGLKIGDRVASSGPHASVFTTPTDECLLIPETVSDEDAVFATIAQIVMQGVRLAQVSLGENAVICGLGLLGQMTTQLVRHVGGWPVIGIDLEPFRQRMALKMGATAVSEPDKANELIRRHSDGRMADVVFEITGNPQAIPEALTWVRRMGRFVMVSSPSGPTTLDFHDLVNARGTVIIGAHNYTHPASPNEYNRWTRRADTELYLRLVEAGLVTAEKLITHRFPAQNASQAYDQLLTNRASSMGVILEWNHN